jgi:hypothetical protein
MENQACWKDSDVQSSHKLTKNFPTLPSLQSICDRKIQRRIHLNNTNTVATDLVARSQSMKTASNTTPRTTDVDSLHELTTAIDSFHEQLSPPKVSNYL